MPSPLHEALITLFRNRPTLAVDLLRTGLERAIPPYTEARISAENLTELQPAEYRADLVILLYEGQPVLGVVVEVQLSRDEDKRYAWPSYVVGLRARHRCPVWLLAVCHEESVARWAERPVDLGAGSVFRALVLGPSAIPVVTARSQAREDPELAVLSAMTHGRAEPETAVQIALSAIDAVEALDAERSTLYLDLVLASLGQAARKALESMDPAKYEYQSDFAKRYFLAGRTQGEALGEARGELRGRAATLLRLLEVRFGALDTATAERVAHASAEQLEHWAVAALDAHTLEDVFRS
jgi:hypothetical protein